MIGGDARTVLERIEQLAPKLLEANPMATWLQVVGARAKLLRETLTRNPEGARALLEQWREGTLTALGLSGDRQPKR